MKRNPHLIVQQVCPMKKLTMGNTKCRPRLCTTKGLSPAIAWSTPRNGMPGGRSTLFARQGIIHVYGYLMN